MAGTMGSIRVGFVEDFKGEDTLPIDVDPECLRALTRYGVPAFAASPLRRGSLRVARGAEAYASASRVSEGWWTYLGPTRTRWSNG